MFKEYAGLCFKPSKSANKKSQIVQFLYLYFELANCATMAVVEAT